MIKNILKAIICKTGLHGLFGVWPDKPAETKDPGTDRRSEKEILAKFKNGGYIESDREMRVLKKWATAGLVHFGVDFVKMKADAKLTKRGKWLLPMM